uniref:Serine-threonine/tyrosine-protein kinase catalytic domain-containing protein n=1 Tax=Arundo donax TaxID=35708 RepID=A0A0A9AUL2_ARUDO
MWGQYSLKTDVYSFGVILLEIITAKRSLSPFGESPLYEALVKHVSKRFSSMDALGKIKLW